MFSSNFLAIPVVRGTIKVKLALEIPTGAPAMLVNEQINTPPVAALKAMKNFIYIIKSSDIFT